MSEQIPPPESPSLSEIDPKSLAIGDKIEIEIESFHNENKTTRYVFQVSDIRKNEESMAVDYKCINFLWRGKNETPTNAHSTHIFSAPEDNILKIGGNADSLISTGEARIPGIGNEILSLKYTKGEGEKNEPKNTSFPKQHKQRHKLEDLLGTAGIVLESESGTKRTIVSANKERIRFITEREGGFKKTEVWPANDFINIISQNASAIKAIFQDGEEVEWE